MHRFIRNVRKYITQHTFIRSKYSTKLSFDFLQNLAFRSMNKEKKNMKLHHPRILNVKISSAKQKQVNKGKTIDCYE